ncbi:MAG: hypothetical protein D6767_06960, partial [Candidatus Hydrogenedentota bacterium]
IFTSKEQVDDAIVLLEKMPLTKDEIGFLQKNYLSMVKQLKEILRKLENQIELVNDDLRKAMEALQEKHKILQEQQELIQKELDFARRVQEKLLPQLPKTSHFEVQVKMIVATSVGGDFYSLYPVDGGLVVAIGDVSGHGVPSALAMVLMRDALLHELQRNPYEDPSKILESMNKVAIRDLNSEMFTTFFYARMDLNEREIYYGNASHTLPMLIRDGNLIELDTLGFMLGASEATEYENKKMELKHGDLLFFYTDGLTELRHKRKNEMLGKEAVAQLLLKNANLPLPEILETLNRFVESYGGTPPYDDDVTYLLIRVLLS